MKVLILIILALPLGLLAQNDTIQAQLLHEKGVAFEQQQLWDSARTAYTKSSELYLSLSDTLHFLDERYQAAGTYLSAMEYKKADSAFSLTIDQYQSEIQKHKLSTFYLEKLTQAVGRQQRFFEAYQVALKAYDSFDENTPISLKSEVLAGLSSLTRLLGFYNEGLKYAYEYRNYAEDPLTESRALNSIGLMHKRLKNKNEAVLYLKKCLALRRKHAPAWTPYILNNLAELYNKVGPYDSALYWSHKGLNYVDSLMGTYNYAQLKGVLLLSRSLSFENLNQIEKAQQALTDGQTIFNELGINYHQFDVINAALRLGMTEFARKELDILSRAELIGSKAIDLNVSKGAYFLNIESLDSALLYFNKAISVFSDTSAVGNIGLQVTESLLLQEALLKKLETLTKLYDKTKTVRYLEEAVQEHQFLIKEIAVDKYEHVSLASSSNFFDQKKRYLDLLIEVSSKLYDYKNESKYLDNIGQIMETKRLNTFKKEFSFSQNKVANVPDSLIFRRRNLQAQINELKSKGEGKDQLLEYQRELENIHLLIKRQNKNFHKTISTQTQSLDVIASRLGETESLIQLSFSNQKLYILVTESTGSKLFSVKWETEQEKNLTEFLESIRNSRKDFNIAAKILINDLNWSKLNIKPGKVRILGDRRLALVPFSVLRQNDKYLLEDYEFLYMNSLIEFDNSTKTNNSELLSFAPFISSTNNSILTGNSDVRGTLGYLPASESEVTKISELWSGKSLLGSNATESAFKDFAPDADIIHLATHSVINNNTPMNSVIAFSDKDSLEDGMLHTYELLQTKLNARLVTLSACNTGVGKYYEGEGMISLATGFNIAGVDNIVMSLWPVPDQTTSTIMTSFYKHLRAGMTVSSALRQAKIDFVSRQDTNLQHPYYWAGFVVSSDEWSERSSTNWILIIILTLISAATFLIARRIILKSS